MMDGPRATIGNIRNLQACPQQTFIFRPRWKASLLTWLIVFASLLSPGEGQDDAPPKQIGVDLCACSPRTFEFTFDFSLVCPPVDIPDGDGVQSTSCLLSPFSDPDTTDLVPTAITAIDVIELGQDVSVLVRETITGSFGNGDSFTYASIVDTPEDVDGPNDIPRVLQLNIVGLNQANEEIINVFIITYTNTCDDHPVLFEDQSIGWVVLSSLGPAVQPLCTAAGGETSPTDPPATDPPVPTTPAPVSPDPDPTSPPSSSTTLAPTVMPVASPSPQVDSPVPSPTSPPMGNSTIMPTSMPTSMPTPIPFPTPTDFMMSMPNGDPSSRNRLLDEFLDGEEFGRRDGHR